MVGSLLYVLVDVLSEHTFEHKRSCAVHDKYRSSPSVGTCGCSVSKIFVLHLPPGLLPLFFGLLATPATYRYQVRDSPVRIACLSKKICLVFSLGMMTTDHKQRKKILYTPRPTPLPVRFPSNVGYCTS